MTTALLDQPVTTVRPSSVAGRDARRPAWRFAAAAVVVASLAALAWQLRSVDLPGTLAGADPRMIAAAVGLFAVSLIAAAYNISSFSPVRVPVRDSILGQLAVCGVRVVTPAALSTPAVVTRVLTRSGATMPQALTTVAAAQLVQLLATFGVVAGLAGVSDSAGLRLPDPTGLAAIAAALAIVCAIAWLLARRSMKVRLGLIELRVSLRELGAHAHTHPGGVAVGVAASAALTLTHVLAFAACVAAAGGHAALVTLAAVYLGAATAGSLLPTPGGVGAVEAALIAGLAASGIPLPVATAATVLSRLVTVWLPALPGWLAVLSLRRRGML